jgi:hypothetical protein
MRHALSSASASTLGYNNTFTWSGPSGVLGCTGQRRVAPLYGGVQLVPNAVPFNPLIWCVAIEPGHDLGLGANQLTLDRPPSVCIQLRTLRNLERNQLHETRNSSMAHTP